MVFWVVVLGSGVERDAQAWLDLPGTDADLFDYEA
jgi:hypothetical protein